jgi:hypothetical protein
VADFSNYYTFLKLAKTAKNKGLSVALAGSTNGIDVKYVGAEHTVHYFLPSLTESEGGMGNKTLVNKVYNDMDLVKMVTQSRCTPLTDSGTVVETTLSLKSG